MMMELFALVVICIVLFAYIHAARQSAVWRKTAQRYANVNGDSCAAFRRAHASIRKERLERYGIDVTDWDNEDPTMPDSMRQLMGDER